MPSKVLSLKPPKIWSLRKADIEFSKWIRERDKFCQYPLRLGCWNDILQCSHYIGRAHKATRWDPDNCVTLCIKHHFKDKQLGYEYQKQTERQHGWDGQYTLFMKRRLGEKGFKELLKRGQKPMNQKLAIMQCMELLKAL